MFPSLTNMSLYRYRAYNATGQTVSGALEADSLTTLEARLRAAGSWLIDAREGGSTEAMADSEVVNVTVKRNELINFFVQMSLLLKAGVTLPNGLDRLADDDRESRMGEVIAGLRDQVAIGTPLNASMGKYPRIFSRHVTSMVEAGEVSGRLPEVFESLSAYYEWLDQLTGDIRQALIYPVMVMTAALSLILLLFTFVVPQFVKLLIELHLKIPVLTQIVMAISNALLGGWPVLLAVVIGGPIALKLALRNESFARAFDFGLMKIPIFGPLVAMFALSRFASNLAMLYKSGITLVRGLEICRHLVGNHAIAHALTEVHRGVLEGTPLHKSLAQHDLFPKMLVTMIATGETSGSLDFALQSVADYYNKIIPRRIKIVFSIFDPVMMVSLIGVVGVVALAVVLPILQLWDAK